METRRKFLKKALYASPVILSVAVRPAHASSAYGGNGGTGGSKPPTPRGRGRGGDGPNWWAFWRWF